MSRPLAVAVAILLLAGPSWAADTPVSVDVSDAAADAPKADGVSGGGGGPISPNAMSMVRKLLTKKTDGRLGTNGVAEVKGHPFLAAFDWSGLADGTMRRPHPPVLASDVDVRYFARKHTSQGGAGARGQGGS
mgnify:CR=1 FL=1